MKKTRHYRSIQRFMREFHVFSKHHNRFFYFAEEGKEPAYEWSKVVDGFVVEVVR